MNAIYASKIDISNFRTFGPNFSLSIPPSPGLVIVYGMNGLGKTTFFEAIEWLLTGDVRRITAAMPNRSQLDTHLTRHAAESNSHFVAATFGPENIRISRSVTKQLSKQELNQLLVSPNWNPIPDDISTYLRLTMFLPQARKFRFEEESPKDQWQLLRGPAGVDQLDVMRRALGGIPTKNAFDRMVTELEVNLSNQIGELADWKDLLNRRIQFRNRVSDARTVTPEQAESFLAALPLRLVAANLAVNSLALQSTEGQSLESKLSATVHALDQMNDDVQSELGKLRNSTELITEWITLRNTIENDSKKIVLIEKQFEATQVKVAAAKQNVEQLRQTLELTERQSAQCRKMRIAAEKAGQSITRLSKSREDLKKLKVDHVATNESAESVRIEIAKNKKTEQDCMLLVQTLSRIESEKDKLETLIARIAAFDATLLESTKAIADLNSLQEEERDLIKREEGFRSKIQHCQLEQKRIESQKNEALAAAEVMSRAIKIVCDHIANDASNCPVCLAEYDHGELKKRAEQS